MIQRNNCESWRQKKHLATSSRHSKWYYKNKVIQVLIFQLHLAVTPIYRVILQPSSNSLNPFSLLVHLNLSPEFLASQFPLFSQFQHDADTADLETLSNDSDAQIVAEIPDGDGRFADLLTPPGTQPSPAFLARPPAAPPLQEEL